MTDLELTAEILDRTADRLAWNTWVKTSGRPDEREYCLGQACSAEMKEAGVTFNILDTDNPLFWLAFEIHRTWPERLKGKGFGSSNMGVIVTFNDHSRTELDEVLEVTRRAAKACREAASGQRSDS